jgi:hypothetical protein
LSGLGGWWGKEFTPECSFLWRRVFDEVRQIEQGRVPGMPLIDIPGLCWSGGRGTGKGIRSSVFALEKQLQTNGLAIVG